MTVMSDDYVKRADIHKAFRPKYAPAVNRAYAAMIDSVPAADVVEVVRCRECVFQELDGADIPVCTGAMAYINTPDDWYCAAGLRKDGGKTNE